MSDQPETPPADPVTSEDHGYATIVSEFEAYRRAGAGLYGAAVLTWAKHLIAGASGET